MEEVSERSGSGHSKTPTNHIQGVTAHARRVAAMAQHELELELERVKAIEDDEERQQAHFRWAAGWGFRDFVAGSDYQEWRKQAVKGFTRRLKALEQAPAPMAPLVDVDLAAASELADSPRQRAPSKAIRRTTVPHTARRAGKQRAAGGRSEAARGPRRERR